MFNSVFKDRKNKEWHVTWLISGFKDFSSIKYRSSTGSGLRKKC